MKTLGRIVTGTGLVVLLGVGALSVLVACTSARRGEALDRPVVLASTEAELGREVYFRHCHHCHPFGAAGLAPAILDKPLPDWAIRMQVRHGFGPMPGFDETQLPDSELEALLAYLDAAKDAEAIPRPER